MAGARQDALDTVFEYHERTKHRPQRYARSLGHLDWSTQPNPFRMYEAARCIELEEVSPTSEPGLRDVYAPGRIPPRLLDALWVSQLFYDSLAISAWKEFQGSRWSLRVNPSSGDLHPTEAYLVSGSVPGLLERPAICHYSPFLHALEVRSELTDGEWGELSSGLPPGSILIGLTSIYWRESWKYGERAFRYCHHDVGHALAAVAMAAAVLGWEARLLEGVADDALGVLFGVQDQDGPEAEHPDCLLVLYPGGAGVSPAGLQSWQLPGELVERLGRTAPEGHPNRLSSSHHPWPILETVSAATAHDVAAPDTFRQSGASPEGALPLREESPVAAREILRRRRSAVAMDGLTFLSADSFFAILEKLRPSGTRPPHAALSWRPVIHPVLFVHRVRNVESGLYLLPRDPEAGARLRSAMRGEFLWRRPPGCPEGLDLYLLLADDTREAAQGISCQQEIASDGAFAVGMLAEFEEPLRAHGSWFYKRLHWEAGAIGQVLYLEAEAAGVRGTGIGCYFDDLMHQLLGLSGRKWQSMYHFTVGGYVEDTRLRTLPSYDHRKRSG